VIAAARASRVVAFVAPVAFSASLGGEGRAVRAGRHGPRQRLLADLDTMSAFGVVDPTVRPVRGAHGEFQLTGPIPAIVQGSVLVGEVAAGAGISVALPSVFVAHLEGCVRRLQAATIAADVRSMPWPFHPLSDAVDAAVRREPDGWVDLGRLDDDTPLWPGWADATVARRGFRVAAPWVPGQGALGYGRWLPTDLLDNLLVRDDGLRVMELDADRLSAALTWHGVQARRDDARVAAALVGWSAGLPASCASSWATTPAVMPVIEPMDETTRTIDLAVHQLGVPVR
jgi:hypothetical protein